MLKAHLSGVDASKARDAYVKQRMADMPAVYQQAMPLTAHQGQLAEAEVKLRDTMLRDFTLGADTSKMTPQELAELNLKRNQPVAAPKQEPPARDISAMSRDELMTEMRTRNPGDLIAEGLRMAKIGVSSSANVPRWGART